MLAWLPASGPKLADSIFIAGNRERVHAGLPALLWNDELADEARQHSSRMRDAGFFDHLDPERGALRRRLGATARRWAVVGENIYQEEGVRDPVQSAVQSWMKSPGHRRNILLPRFTHTGLGVAGSGRSYWFTQEFAGGRLDR